MKFKKSISYPDIFEVSECGEVRSVRTGKILKQTIPASGYCQIATKVGGRNGRNLCVKVHRIVAEGYCENIDNKPTVNHIDGVKTNNHYTNLEWCTVRENVQHAYDTGLKFYPKEDYTCSSILSEQDVRYIRTNYVRGSRKYGSRALGRKFNISHDSVLKVVKSK